MEERLLTVHDAADPGRELQGQRVWESLHMLIQLESGQIQLDNPPTEEACFKVDHTRRTHSVKYAHAVRN